MKQNNHAYCPGCGNKPEALGCKSLFLGCAIEHVESQLLSQRPNLVPSAVERVLTTGPPGSP